MKTQSSDYLEMLFENRNKAYGAYDLRVNYENRLFKSFGLALLVAGFFFLIPYVLTQILTAHHSSPGIFDSTPVELKRTKFVIVKDQPKVPVTAARTKMLAANTTYKVVQKTEENKIEEKKNVDPVSPVETKGIGIITDSVVTGGPTTTIVDSIPTAPMSIASVDVPPSFPGGEAALMEFLKDKINYPESARTLSISGRVYVSFIVNEKGEIEEVEIMRGPGHGMEKEVIRVIGLMPKWNPGKYHNQYVKTALVLPVFFSLK